MAGEVVRRREFSYTFANPELGRDRALQPHSLGSGRLTPQ